MSTVAENPGASALDADTPLVDPSLDQLGYAPFAKRLSEVVLRMTPTEGVVLAIYGAWGSGKSSLLNFVKAYIRSAQQGIRPVVFDFNPWWYSGQEDLTRRYFHELCAALGNEDERGKRIAERIGALADSLADAPIPYAGLAKVVASIAKTYSKEKSITDLKSDVVSLLRNYDRNVLVVIDDIDRLTGEEIRQIFKLVKAVGNFPRTIFLLAFDKGQVCQALGENSGLSGEEFLEKIVQTPYELPLPDQPGIQRIFFNKLNVILTDAPEEQFDRPRWHNLFANGIAPFLKTPRDVVRLCNSLSTTYPAVQNEVNPVDFIGIESLRIFTSTVYDQIRHNQDQFAGIAPHSMSSTHERDTAKAFLEGMLQEISAQVRPQLTEALTEIFPRIAGVLGNLLYSHDSLRTWQRDLRACHPDHFATYFRLAVPANVISNTEMRSILAIANDAGAFSTKLFEISNLPFATRGTKLKQFFIQMEAFTDQPEIANSTTTILSVLFKNADKLYRPQDKSLSFYDISDPFLSIGRIVHQILKPCSQAERFAHLRSAIDGSDAVGFICHEVAILGQQHGKRTNSVPGPESERSITSGDLEMLEQLALAKIKAASADRSLNNAPDLAHILFCWRTWGGPEEARNWVQEFVKTNQGLLGLLVEFVSRAYVEHNSKSGTEYRLDPKTLEPFVDPTLLVDRVADLLATDELNSEQRRALIAFQVGWKLRAQGINPSSPRDEIDEWPFVPS